MAVRFVIKPFTRASGFGGLGVVAVSRKKAKRSRKKSKSLIIKKKPAKKSVVQ